MTQPIDRRAIAHAALALTEPPYLKHYKRARFQVWKGVALTTSALPGPGFNFASVLVPDAPRLDDLLPVARDFFSHCKKGWGIQVEGDAGHPMEAELKARGWAIDEDEPAFVLDSLTPEIRCELPPGFTVRQVSDLAGTNAFHDLVGEAFGATPELSMEMRPLPTFIDDPDIAIFIGSVAGKGVTAAGYSRSGPTAVLWGVATLPEYRSRGYGSFVSREALAHAATQGCTTATLRSGLKSIPVYERLGFQYVCQHRTYAFPGT
jgi:GNAT superfamily N-acetyltransferase